LSLTLTHPCWQCSLLIPNIALPIRLFERRKGYAGHSLDTTLSGLSVRLEDDKRDNLELGYPSSHMIVCMGQRMTAVEPALENETLGPEGVLEGMPAHRIIIDCGNTSPLTSRKIFQECQKKGVSFLDAAVSGGPDGAQAGTLSVMVGGSPEAFEQTKPIFNAISKKVTYFGPSGSGQMAKLINNMVVAINIAAISEALVLGQKAGLEISKLREAMRRGAAQSWALDTYGKIWLERAPGQRAIKEVYREKQLGWAFEIASELEVPLPGTTCVHELFKMARDARGWWCPRLCNPTKWWLCS